MAQKQIMLSAVTPSGQGTLGNYLGALKNWVQLQDQYDCLFFVVDLHSITVRQDPQVLKERSYTLLANYLAAGLDPKKVTFFVQSHVPQHAELTWILTCYTYMGELQRMTQFKDKSSKQGKNIPAGLFSYPVLMAADILLYGTHQVPVGADQKQHVELTRDLALRFNHLYGEDTFVVPEPYIPKVGAKIMSLSDPTAKMSKSDDDPHGSVYIMDPDKVIEKKFKRAVTDSGSEIQFSDEKPGISNLLTIQSALTGKPISELQEGYRGKMYGHLKVETAQMVMETLGPIRDESSRLLGDRTYLNQVLKEGAERARARAQTTLDRVSQRVGFIPRFS